MKILYIVTKSNWGGAQRHVYDLSISMKERGHDVKVAMGGSGLLKEKLESSGIFTYPIGDLGRDISTGKDLSSFQEIFRIIKDQKPDVLHLHSPKAQAMGALSGRLLGVKKIIMTVHGWTWNEKRPFGERAVIVLGQWLTSLLCHKVIVISNHDHEQALRLPGLKKRVTLIALGIKTSALMSVDGARQFIAKALSMDVSEYNKKVVIGTIAELHRNKGLDYLIDAMKDVIGKNSDTICLVMGDGEEKARLQARIKELGLENNFFLLGYVPDAAQYLKALRIFVLPSLKEGLPYVLLEAGAASLSVVTTSVGGIPDIIEDMHSGMLVQPKNSRDLAHALLFTIEHPKEAKDYANNLRMKVQTTFSFDKMIDSVSAVYTRP